LLILIDIQYFIKQYFVNEKMNYHKISRKSHRSYQSYEREGLKTKKSEMRIKKKEYQ